MKRPKILITGGLGHLGSGLARSLSPFYDIDVLDNFLTQRYCSLLGSLKHFHFIEGSFEDLTVKNLSGYDAILHLAAITDAASSFKNQGIVEKTNVELTKSFIDKVAEASKPHFIFPSSTSVYGTACTEVFEGDPSHLNPQSPYATSKLAIEEYLKNSNARYTVLRLGTVFGISPGIRFHTAINKFCYQATMKQPLTVWKQNYSQVRPYLGINDACQAFRIALHDPRTHHQTYNVLTENYSLEKIIEIIRKVCEIEIDFVDSPLLNQFSYKVNYQKFKDLGFQPKDDLERVISETIGLFG